MHEFACSRSTGKLTRSNMPDSARHFCEARPAVSLATQYRTGICRTAYHRRMPAAEKVVWIPKVVHNIAPVLCLIEDLPNDGNRTGPASRHRAGTGDAISISIPNLREPRGKSA